MWLLYISIKPADARLIYGTPCGGLNDSHDVSALTNSHRIQPGNTDHAGQGGERPCQI